LSDLAPQARPVEWTAHLARDLRQEGVPCTLLESLTACEALEQLDAGDAFDLYHGLKAALTFSREHEPAFDRCFWRCWNGREPDTDSPQLRRHVSKSAGRVSEATATAASALERLREAEETTSGMGDGADEVAGASYSPSERLARRAFERLSEPELREVDRMFDRIRLRLAVRRSRRYRPDRWRGRPDLRRSFRGALSHDGELLRLARRRRRLERPRVVLLCDVSGSMERYSRFLIRFLLSAGRDRDVESFVFSTRLTRLTPWLSASRVDEAIESLGRRVHDWSGGTRIGACLDEFVREHGRSLLGRRTVVVVMSDGLDRGDVELLEHAMSAIHRRSRRVIWLNPLLASPEYEPAARGMRAALPHVDVFAPGHSLDSLLQLERHLR
jgi:uncharacterized protein with von Willebrand factor type A (vWA) domain